MASFPKSIRKTFTMAFLGLTVLIALFMLVLIKTEQKQAIKNSSETLKNAVDLQVHYVNRWFTLNIMENIRSLSRLPSIQADNLDQVKIDLEALIRDRSDLMELFYVDSNGDVLVDTRDEKRDLNLSNRALFKAAQKGEEFISPVVMSIITDEPIVVFSVPIMRENELHSITVGTVTLSHLYSLITDHLFGKSGKFILFDKMGHAMATSHRFSEALSFDPEAVGGSREGFINRIASDGDEYLLYVKATDHSDIFIGGEINMDDIKLASLRMSQFTLWICTLLGFLALLFMAMISKKINGALSDLGDEVSSVSAGNYVITPEETLSALPEELRGIAEATNTLKEKVESSIETIREQGIRDTLTGLYNRRFFEEELQRLSRGDQDPVAVVTCDVNGLKLINDGMGHLWGDRLIQKAAELLKGISVPGDILARVGGDEFSLIIPKCQEERFLRLDQDFHEAIESANRDGELPLHMAWGAAKDHASWKSLAEIVKDSDERMYELKEIQRENARNSILTFFLRYIKEKERHRLSHMENCRTIMDGFLRSLPEVDGIFRKKMLRLASIHDIGLIGIPPEILEQTGPIEEEAKKAVRSHSEIGYRIAFAVPHISDLATPILHHHQRWDGDGYPLREIPLSGEDIPIESRIMNLVDAYEAMINRTYAPPLTHEEAIAEIVRCSGTQFDPEWAKKLVSFLGNWRLEN